MLGKENQERRGSDRYILRLRDELRLNNVQAQGEAENRSY